MTRPLTLICLLLALGSGLFLYQTKHRAQLLDREITQVMKTADATRARSGVLQAEYQLLSDPQRLGDLAISHLSLRPTAPDQFSTWSDLPRRLPPIGLPATPDAAPLEAPGPAPADAVAEDDLPLPPIPPQAAPVLMAQTATPPVVKANPPPPVASVPVPAVRAAAPVQAPRAPAPPARLASLPTQTVTPIVSSVIASSPRNVSYGLPSAAYQSAPTAPAASSLGMARSMRLPSPLTSAYAAGPFGNGQ